jgi:Xaa-Pro aminopeptidase
MYPHQADRLTAVLEREGLEALVATSPENIAYITGFRSLSQAIYRQTPLFAIFTRRDTALVLPVIDVPAVAAGGVDVAHVISYGEFHVDFAGDHEATRRAERWASGAASGAADALARALETLGIREGPVGVDDGYLAFDAWHRAGERLAPMKVIAAGTELAEARAVKGPWELECLHRALAIAEEGANAVIQMLAPGVTEHEAAALYEKTILERGGSPCATIVLFGERSAIPAAYPSDRALRARDLVRLDVGCVFRGYHADLARTAVMGQPDERQEAVYRAIETGLEEAVVAIKPGVPAGRIHEVAVDATRQAGLPTYRRHHVGHGIGLEPYEPPILATAEDRELEQGMVLRVETPYYQVGWGGLAIMDTVYVTRAGASVLNRSARGLVLLD